MDPGILIGTLAVFTIGAVILISIGHFGFLMRDHKNRYHVANVLAGGEGATSVASRCDDSVPDVPLKMRLDASIASAHPDDPEPALSKNQRYAKHSVERQR